MVDLSRLPSWTSRNMLLPVTCCFIAGAIGAKQISQISPTLALIIALALLATFILLKKQLGAVLSLLMIFFLVVGFLHTRQALQPPEDPSHIYNLVDEKTLLTLDGTVTGMVTQNQEKSRFVLNVNKIIRREQPGAGKTLPATGRIQLSVRGQTPPSLTPGQRVLVVASVDRIKNYQTPGTFDYVLHMRNRSIYSSGWINSVQLIQPVTTPDENIGTDITARPERIRQQISRFLQSRCDPVAAGLYQALLIGDRGGLSPRLIEQFALTGCMHLLAISGLHMGLLTLLVYGLLTWTMKRSQWLLLHTHISTLALTLSFPILFCYGFIAGMNTPVFRSLIMAAILLAAVLVRRHHSILHLIAAAALITLSIHPLSLFTVSFQLSFAAILAIALVYPKIVSFYFQEGIDKKYNKTFALTRWPLTAFFVSLAATSGTLPLLLYHFNRFSPIGPLMNLLVEPLLCFIALPLGLIAIPMIFLAPDLAASLFHFGGIALHAADVLTNFAGRLPFASVWTITPSVLEIICYFSLLFFALAATHSYKKLILGLLSCLLIIHFTTGLFLTFPKKTAEISYLDVGQGTASLLELPDGTNILIDGGGSFSKRFNVGKNIIGPFFWKKRIWHIDTVIITHPDSDHYNGLDFIINRFHPQKIYTNGQPGHAGYEGLFDLIAQKNIAARQTGEKGVLHKDSLCRLTCLGMPGVASANDSDNDQSLVLSLQCGKKRFLFPGDIEKKAETLLVQQKINVAADVLLAPHHGSKTSSSSGFLQAVNPQLIVVSAGRTKKNLFPAAVHRSQWEQQDIPLLITGINGTITCQTDGEALTITR